MSRASRSCVAAAIAVALFNGAAPASAADPGSLKLTPLATYDAGDVGSAEIVAFDASTKRLFLVNAQTSTVDILDVSNPSSPTKVTTIDTAALGSPNSVAVRDGVVAVAKIGRAHV